MARRCPAAKKTHFDGVFCSPKIDSLSLIVFIFPILILSIDLRCGARSNNITGQVY